MTTPRLERLAADRADFTDSTGECWRVHDRAFGPPLARPGYRRRLALESQGTNTRYFVNAKGERRAYSFKRTESRRLTLDDCARQFSESGYCWKGPPFIPPTHPTG